MGVEGLTGGKGGIDRLTNALVGHAMIDRSTGPTRPLT